MSSSPMLRISQRTKFPAKWGQNNSVASARGLFFSRSFGKKWEEVQTASNEFSIARWDDEEDGFREEISIRGEIETIKEWWDESTY